MGRLDVAAYNEAVVAENGGRDAAGRRKDGAMASVRGGATPSKATVGAEAVPTPSMPLWPDEQALSPNPQALEEAAEAEAEAEEEAEEEEEEEEEPAADDFAPLWTEPRSFPQRPSSLQHHSCLNEVLYGCSQAHLSFKLHLSRFLSFKLSAYSSVPRLYIPWYTSPS